MKAFPLETLSVTVFLLLFIIIITIILRGGKAETRCVIVIRSPLGLNYADPPCRLHSRAVEGGAIRAQVQNATAT